MQTSTSANNVDVVKKYMKKYKKQTPEDILYCILKNGDKTELLEWRTLALLSNLQQIKDQGIRELKIEQTLSGYTYKYEQIY